MLLTDCTVTFVHPAFHHWSLQVPYDVNTNETGPHHFQPTFLACRHFTDSAACIPFVLQLSIATLQPTTESPTQLSPTYGPDFRYLNVMLGQTSP